MGTFLRWAGLAAFCLAFGFAGTLGGAWVMQDELRGPRGETGDSVQGPPGPPGSRGPAGESVDIPMSVAELDNVLTNLMNTQRSLITRVATLESSPSGSLSDCMPTQVVTDVDWNQFASVGSPLNVRTSAVCLPLR